MLPAGFFSFSNLGHLSLTLGSSVTSFYTQTSLLVFQGPNLDLSAALQMFISNFQI